MSDMTFIYALCEQNAELYITAGSRPIYGYRWASEGLYTQRFGSRVYSRLQVNIILTVLFYIFYVNGSDADQIHVP
jgi:hypothetical protein